MPAVIILTGLLIALLIVLLTKSPKQLRLQLTVSYIFTILAVILIGFFLWNFEKINHNQYIILMLATVLYRSTTKDVRTMLFILQKKTSNIPK